MLQNSFFKLSFKALKIMSFCFGKMTRFPFAFCFAKVFRPLFFLAKLCNFQRLFRNVFKMNFATSRRGVSLIEMIAATAIFGFVAIISAGALLAMADVQRKAAALRAVQDNLNYAFEMMVKEMRTGTSYHCGTSTSDFSNTPRDCPVGGGPSFTFINAPGRTVTYVMTSGRLARFENTGGSCNIASLLALGPPPGFTCLYVTAPEVEINILYLTFYVRGATLGDSLQPRVTIILSGTAGEKEKIKTRLNIQTTISQRAIDS
jgi:type II secretory pathway pseudopilin PulG